MSATAPQEIFDCHAILLAAGRGRRFDPEGQISKLHQEIQTGISVIEQSARQLIAVLPQTQIVTRAAQAWPAGFLKQFAETMTICLDADLGMAHSLVWGVQQLPPACDAVVIALADMPFIQCETITAIVSALRNGAQIAVPVYQGQRGNPVGFARSLFSELLQLHGDQGARALLKRYPVVEIEVDDAGILRDIDTPEDLFGPSLV